MKKKTVRGNGRQPEKTERLRGIRSLNGRSGTEIFFCGFFGFYGGVINNRARGGGFDSLNKKCWRPVRINAGICCETDIIKAIFFQMSAKSNKQIKTHINVVRHIFTSFF